VTTYGDFVRERRGVTAREILTPVTAHMAFGAAARFFGMPLVRATLCAG